MINESDFEEAYTLLCSIFEMVPTIEADYAITNDYYENKRKHHCCEYYDGQVKYIATSRYNLSSRLGFSYSFDHSFIMGDWHREADINIRFAYKPNNSLRIGSDVIPDYDFSEENIFQQSLVLPKEMVCDLEFLLFIRNKGFDHSFILAKEAFGIDGLRKIHKNAQEVVWNIMSTQEK